MWSLHRDCEWGDHSFVRHARRGSAESPRHYSEGLGTLAQLHPLQAAFIEEQAAQCGYCIGGMIMTAKVLLDKNPHPSEDQIKQALEGQLCRCGTHLRIVRAIQRAASKRA